MGNLRFGSRSNQSKSVLTLNQPVPDFGGDYFADTSLHNPSDIQGDNVNGWAQIQCITATVLDAATQCNIANIAGVTLPAGSIIPGLFSQIKLTSGSIIAYRATD